MSGTPFTRRTRLELQPLEDRRTPTGSGAVTASFAPLTGTLTLTGDDHDNVIRIVQTAGAIQVQSVKVDPTDPNEPATTVPSGSFPGVRTLKVLLLDGNDDVSLDDSADFVLTGPATFDLADGDNTINLVTTGRLDLGGLTLTAKDGLDRFTVEGGTGSQVTGNVVVSHGIGRGRNDPADMVSRTRITGLAVHGAGGLKFTAADGDDDLILANVAVDKALTANAGVGSLYLEANASHLGSVSFTGTTDPLNRSSFSTFAAKGTTVDRTVLLKSPVGVGFSFEDVTTGPVTVQTPPAGNTYNSVLGTVTVLGNLTITGGRHTINIEQVEVEDPPPDGSNYGEPSVLAVTGDITMNGVGDIFNYGSVVRARNLTLSGSQVQYSQYYDQDDGESVLDLTGNLVIRGDNVQYYQTDGTAEIDGNVQLLGKSWAGFDNNVGGFGFPVTTLVRGSVTQTAMTGEANHEIDGTSMIVLGNLAVTGIVSADVSYETDELSEVGGTVTLNGGVQDDSFWAKGNFQSKSVTLNMKNGNNFAVIGSPDEGRPTTITGNLKMTTGSGTDSVSFTNASVTGTTTLVTGAGADELRLNAGTVLGGAVSVDLGSGADVLEAGLALFDPFDPGGPPVVPPGTVTFNATSTIKMGAGNDKAQLGVPGDPDGKVVVAAGAALTVDGGLNLDTLEPGQTDGTVNTSGVELP
ncbi:MAG TPA: hypothetical protein VKD90_01095 [Gemmataceae bacterium]|nr:hypothetical protein [Gemmataceae bacterium]